MIVAGEQSGDILGAGLIRSLRKHFPDCEFSGIGGEKMMSEGFQSHFELERLSVMGFIDPLKRLPELLGMIRKLKKSMQEESIDIFIGIDSPDFTIRLESAAKAYGIFSVHYVSPSVWAWRQGRIKKIKKSVDLMLTLLPFEAEFYEKHELEVKFVGHPLADDFPLVPDQEAARKGFGIANDCRLLALMPGSRRSELEQLFPVMLELIVHLREKLPTLEFILPAANPQRMDEIKQMAEGHSLEGVHLVLAQSHQAMMAADCILMASGTTSLEAMLLKRPMVISYKWPALTWAILSRLVKVDFIGLPNLLAGEELVPELLQDKATVENMSAKLLPLLTERGSRAALVARFTELHLQLKQNASDTAAQAIATTWNKRQSL